MNVENQCIVTAENVIAIVNGKKVVGRLFVYLDNLSKDIDDHVNRIVNSLL